MVGFVFSFNFDSIEIWMFLCDFQYLMLSTGPLKTYTIGIVLSGIFKPKIPEKESTSIKHRLYVKESRENRKHFELITSLQLICFYIDFNEITM